MTAVDPGLLTAESWITSTRKPRSGLLPVISPQPTILTPGARTAYVCGPMATKPEHNYPLFIEVAAALRSEGKVVYTPNENITPELYALAEEDPIAFRASEHYADLMRMSYCQILQSEELYLLPDWMESEGARKEIVFAHSIHTPLFNWHPDPSERLLVVPIIPSDLVVGWRG